MYKVACSRCGGTGILPQHRRIVGGTCFRCDGKGYVMQSRKPSVPHKWFTVFAKEIGGRALQPVFRKQAASANQLARAAKKQLAGISPRHRQWDPESVVVREG